MVCLFPAEIKWGELGVFTLFNISGGVKCALLFKFAKNIYSNFIYNMNNEVKIYVAPQCEVMELELQGMIAASGDFELPGYPAGDLP